MGLFSSNYSKPGPGIEKNRPQKKGLPLFFEILGREFFELIKLNLLFVLFCIPIVTIPAAMTAMSRITLTMVQDQNHFLWSDFLKAFKADFMKSTIGGFLLFLGLSASGYGVFFYGQMTVKQPLFFAPMGISACIALLMILMGFYLFPMITLVDLPLKAMLKNAMLLSVVCLLHNLGALAASGVLVGLFLLYFPLTLPVGLVFLFAPANFITTFCAYTGMKKYVLKSVE